MQTAASVIYGPLGTTRQHAMRPGGAAGVR